MSAIAYDIIQHRGSSRILVTFPYNKTWTERIKKVPGALWSQTHKGWHIPDTPENRKKCSLPTGLPAVLLSTAKSPLKTIALKLSANNREQLKLFLQQLTLKKYSPSTLRTYQTEFLQLLQLLHEIKVQELTPEHLKRYMLYCALTLKLSENSLHSRLNALKFYYEQVLKKEKFFWEIPRPKKPLQLPKLLNETELAKLFNALTNKKHKAMLFTIYSAGLRVSELVNLKMKDIDSKRMQVFIERAKGKKDRYVNLSPVLLDILRHYLQTCKPRPIVYLFESEQTQSAYPIRTVQQIFINAKTKAGIQKDVGVHSLRHSFATHLLDKGTDIKYIKDLLGHFDIRTTERYLHVSKKQLVNIISPFDDLMKSEKIDW
ncbi:MAG: site-specific integrase [Sphingobacteriales bacterium]|nr:site-specific integrase [Sphingobacteriales bacterium]